MLGDWFAVASATHINIVTLNLFQGLFNLVLLALIDAEGVNTLECRVDFSLPKILKSVDYPSPSGVN